MNEDRFSLEPHMLIERDQDGDEVILVDGRTGVLCACNGTAALLIAALEAGANLDQLVAGMTAAYRVPESRARSDVLRFLDGLIANGYARAEAVPARRRAVA